MLKGFPSRRDNIILAAIDIINESGMQGLSTKGLALKQGISESLLYKHFKSLDEVLIAVIEYFTQYDTMICNTVQKRDISYKEKILEYIKSFVELYESYPALASVMLNYTTLIHYEHTKKMVIDIFKERNNFVQKMVREGQAAGEIRDIFTPLELTDTIMGIVTNTTFRWKVSEYQFSLKEHVLTTINKVIIPCL